MRFPSILTKNEEPKKAILRRRATKGFPDHGAFLATWLSTWL
jgi:hypothetical protein